MILSYFCITTNVTGDCYKLLFFRLRSHSDPSFYNEQMMPTQISLSSLFIFVCLLAHIHAQEFDKNYCPTSVSQGDTIYSPFVPWWVYYSSSQQCWAWASCIYIRADESRKQQFAATALVMGLIPLTFKDIAWPGRRVILLSKPLNAGLEVLVRGLGMDPRWPFEKQTDKENVVRAWWLASDLATLTWGWVGIACLLTAVCLVLSSGALLVAELYSKRSALGCPYPAFVFTWYVVGFAPAALHTFFSKMRRLRKRRKSKALSRNGTVVEDKEAEMIISAVQGGEEWWIVQLIWAIFYIAGTLIVRSFVLLFLKNGHAKIS